MGNSNLKDRNNSDIKQDSNNHTFNNKDFIELQLLKIEEFLKQEKSQPNNVSNDKNNVYDKENSFLKSYIERMFTNPMIKKNLPYPSFLL